MFVRIARHEWRMLAADATLWLTLIIFLFSMGYGVMNGATWVAFQHAGIAQALEEEARRYEDLKSQVREIEAGTRRPGFANPQSPDAAGGRLALRYTTLPPSA